MTSEVKKSPAGNSCSKTLKVEKKNLVPDLTLPGFHYLGPGNRIDNGSPTNTIDAVAMKHDIAYEQAMDDFKNTHDVKQTEEEIKLADKQFLEDMEKTIANTPTEFIGKAVGTVGIGVKKIVEKSVGFTLYPYFEKCKEENDAVQKKS